MIDNLILKIVKYLKDRINGLNTYITPQTIHIDKTAKIEGSFIKGEVTIGKGSQLKNVHIDGIVSVGDYSFLSGPNINIHGKVNGVEIGNFCSIARNVDIQEHNHYVNNLTTSLFKKNFFDEPEKNEIYSKGKVVIGNDVWIGTQVVILSGTEIGNGAIIGSGCVVTKSIPDYAIVVGNPSKIIGFRFEEEVINRLRELKWWNLSLGEVNKLYENFKTKD